MFDKFRNFWRVFWQSIKNAYNKAFKQPLETTVQGWRDLTAINLLDVFVTKLNNLTNTEATFDVVSDSVQAERLKTLCKSLESHRFDITAAMLADGDYFVFPATNQRGEIVHSYLPQACVRIINMDGEEITEAYGIVDWYTDADNRIFFLLRHHALDKDGTLTVSYSVVDGNYKPAHLEQWSDYEDLAFSFAGAGHIGFGRYKSPANSRGLSPIYGVPLNFGCAEIEKKIFTDLKMVDDEFKNGKSVIFTDPRNLLTDKEKGGYKIAENIIPIQSRAGQSGSNIDIFNPTLRFSEHYSKLVSDLSMYEKQVGTSKGILTDNETAYTATATAVRRSNSDTLALLDKIRNSIDAGNRMTLEADAVYLNIARDLWDYASDWYDPFEDPAEQWDRLVEAKEQGAAEVDDLIRWAFPRLDSEQIEEKKAKIAAAQTSGADEAIERILAGR